VARPALLKPTDVMGKFPKIAVRYGAIFPDEGIAGENDP
jgi:hypothetical protein